MARMLGILGVLVIWMAHGYGYASAKPTDGFTPKKLSEANFEIQKPYDKAVSQRYSFVDGVHSLWVFKNDKPHSINSNTAPRTEIRITGYDYTSGVWQFEGDMYVPRGTTGVSVMQVFGGVEHATSLMLHVYDGQLKRYNSEVVASDVYDKWIHLNVIHDADQGKVSVFVDGQQKLVADDRGRKTHYFKCGVYAQRNPSSRMESRWKNIKDEDVGRDIITMLNQSGAILRIGHTVYLHPNQIARAVQSVLPRLMIVAQKSCQRWRNKRWKWM